MLSARGLVHLLCRKYQLFNNAKVMVQSFMIHRICISFLCVHVWLRHPGKTVGTWGWDHLSPHEIPAEIAENSSGRVLHAPLLHCVSHDTHNFNIILWAKRLLLAKELILVDWCHSFVFNFVIQCWHIFLSFSQEMDACVCEYLAYIPLYIPER